MGLDTVFDSIKEGMRGAKVSAAQSGASGGNSFMAGLSGFLSAFGSAFSGGFASSGTIPRGQWGIVGERGPEPVFAGGGNLHVMPNSSMGGMAATINVFGVQNPDQFQNTEVQMGRRLYQTWEQGQRGR
jgi:hypothetical protein